jgi:DNA-binding response OmpR family regulator
MMKRLLVVDDDAAILKLVRENMSEDYDITDTGDPTEALGLALESRPDCVLLDLMMPRFSGLELCQTFASVSQTQQIPVFVMTGHPSDDHREYCLNLGARDFFEKPLDFERMKLRIHNVLHQHKSERRSDSRVQLKVVLKLTGVTENGKNFELLTSTDNVSPDGFLCRCSVPIAPQNIVQVFLMGRQGEVPVGRAQLCHVQWPGRSWQSCGFKIIEKTGTWVL